MEISIDILVINIKIQETLLIGNILQYHIFYFIVQYVGTLLEGSMIRELCLQRDNDDFTLSKSELSILIDNLCDLAVTYVTLENGLIYYEMSLLFIAFLYSYMMCICMSMFKANKDFYY